MKSKLEVEYTVALIKCPHCEKVGLNQQTGENKFFCKNCQRPFENENTKEQTTDIQPVPNNVKSSQFGCMNCLWYGCECRQGSMYKPSMPIYDEPECDNYTYYD